MPDVKTAIFIGHILSNHFRRTHIIYTHAYSFLNTTDAIKMKSNMSNALYMGIVEDSAIFRFELALLRDLNIQPRLAL